MHEIKSTWPITSVTIYPQSARILHRSALALKEGENKIIIPGLPEGLAETSLRLEVAADSDLSILDIYTEDQYLTGYDENLYRKEYQQFEKLASEQKKLEMRYKNYLEEFALFLNKESILEDIDDNPILAINTKSWDEFFKFLNTRLKENRNQAREVILEWLQLCRKREAAERNLQKYTAYDQVREHQVIIQALAKTDRTETLDLFYLQPGVSWHPAYTLRADVENKSLTIALLAIVKQATGQDWLDAELYFSTAIPQESCELPELRSKVLKEQAAPVLMAQPVSDMKRSLNKKDAIMERLEAAPEPEMEADEVYAQEQAKSASSAPAKKSKKMAAKPAPAPARSMAMPSAYPASGPGGGGVGGKQSRDAYAATPVAVAAAPAAPAAGYGEWQAAPGAIEAELRSLVSGLDEQFGNVLSLDKLWDTYSDFYACLRDEYSPAENLPRGEESRINRYLLAGISLLDSLGGFDYRFKAASSALKIPGSNQPVQVGLDMLTRPLELVYFAIPLEHEQVYLKARFTNSGVNPYPAGPALVFADNNLLGNITLPTLGLNQGMEVSLGSDRDIKILRRETSVRSTAGLVGKELQTSVKVEIEIVNYKKVPIKLELLDRLPLSANEKEVTVQQQELTPTPQKITTRGIVCWQLELKPQEKLIVKLAYVIKHPEDFQLTMSYADNPHQESERS